MQTVFDFQVILTLACYYFYPKDYCCIFLKKQNYSVSLLTHHANNLLATKVSTRRNAEGRAMRSSTHFFQVVYSVADGTAALTTPCSLRRGSGDCPALRSCCQNLRRTSGSLCHALARPSLERQATESLQFCSFYSLLFRTEVGYNWFFLDYNCVSTKINSAPAFIGLPCNLFLIQEAFESEREPH